MSNFVWNLSLTSLCRLQAVNLCQYRYFCGRQNSDNFFNSQKLSKCKNCAVNTVNIFQIPVKRKSDWAFSEIHCPSPAASRPAKGLYNRTIKWFSDCQTGRFWRNFQLHIIRVRSVSFANFDSIFLAWDLKFNFKGGLWCKIFWYDQRFSH